MKNGIASSVNCSMVWKNFSTSDARLSCANSRIVSIEDRPSDIAIGMPMMRNDEQRDEQEDGVHRCTVVASGVSSWVTSLIASAASSASS